MDQRENTEENEYFHLTQEREDEEVVRRTSVENLYTLLEGVLRFVIERSDISVYILMLIVYVPLPPIYLWLYLWLGLQ